MEEPNRLEIVQKFFLKCLHWKNNVCRLPPLHTQNSIPLQEGIVFQNAFKKKVASVETWYAEKMCPLVCLWSFLQDNILWLAGKTIFYRCLILVWFNNQSSPLRWYCLCWTTIKFSFTDILLIPCFFPKILTEHDMVCGLCLIETRQGWKGTLVS